jgi:hypothetical protein
VIRQLRPPSAKIDKGDKKFACWTLLQDIPPPVDAMDSLEHLINLRIIGIKSLVLKKTPQDKIVSDLQEACVPVSTDACRTCANPCDVGHLEYPPKFNVDTASDMLGSVKPYMRQVCRIW